VNWNSGARDEILVGRWDSAPLRPLFSYDLSPLGTNAVIQSVALNLWTDATGGAGTVGNLELHPLYGTPVEGTGDGSSAANGAGTGATWVSRTGGSGPSDLWTNAGGDYGATVLSTATGYDATVTDVPVVFASTTNFVALAQSDVSTGQRLNLLLLSPTTEAGPSNFLSRLTSNDSGITAQLPLLTVGFTGNRAPAAYAGPAPGAVAGLPAALLGTVSNAVVSVWTQTSGPGLATFTSAIQPATSVTFSLPGTYGLRLTGSNALATVASDLLVTVASNPPPQLSLAVPGGQCRLQVGGLTGMSYTVQSSTNLSTWLNVLTTNPATMPLVWTDLNQPKLPLKFYRVLATP
jgi:hypothetical protein